MAVVCMWAETKPLRSKASITVLEKKRFISFMVTAGLKSTTADPCLFYRVHEDSFLYLQFMLMMDFSLVTKDEEIEVF